MARLSSANDALQRIKRFYKSVTVEPVEGGFGVALDGRVMKTPGKAPLTAPTEAAARMIADEWSAQAEYIVFPEMAATRHAYTAIDRVAAVRREVAEEVGRYAGSDLLCYFAEEPASLVERQQREWAPLLDWAEHELELKFSRTAGISPQAQPPQTLLRIEALALDLDDFRLAALAYAGALFGSSILGLALIRGRLTAEEAFNLSRLDEAFQEEQWGIDAEAAQRTDQLRRETMVLEQWLKALG
ncbi:MAG: ATP12 family protein [Alphaproteobacteria bacterium]